MEYNVKPTSLDIKDEKQLKCFNCNRTDCSCKKLNKSTKRGYKSHVPSACVNCKTAHLACDISRPCKRCVSLNKTDTCHDMQHKKRGRPKLREKRVYSPNENNYEILYGTIQTPAITIKPARNIIPAEQPPPFKSKKRISFIHEPIESFQQQQPPIQKTPTSSFLSMDSILPSIQLSSNIEFNNNNNTQPLFLNDNTINPSLSPSQSTSSSLIQSHTNEPNDTMINIPTDLTVTIILSMEVCCAKVSDDIIKCWGYYPQELAHRSLYDFISPKDSDRLARLHRLLLDNANSQHIPLPPTERTTSSLFSEAATSTLSIKANGSRSFSDTIHIKKRSGDYELYEVVVYVGGGLGADLYNPLTLSKQYMVAQFKKHEYEVMAPPPPISQQQQQQLQPITSAAAADDSLLSFVNPKPNEDFYYNTIQPIAAFSPLSPITPTSPSVVFNNDLFKKDFPSYEKVEKRLSSNNSKFTHISSSSPSISSPKFNIAPINNNKSSLQRFLPSISSLRPPATVTHPTQQYFLQTSSSTLNAAASAAQNKSRPTPSDQNVVATGRKMEMSIRSLLC